ncbi:hypothetical protein Unana1_03530 [Umbelopsis nana]
MPSILVMITIYSSLYPDQLFPLLEDLKRNCVLTSTVSSVLSTPIRMLLQTSDVYTSFAQCECYEIKSAIVSKEMSFCSVARDASSEVEVDMSIELAQHFTDSKDVATFVQELGLVIAACPPSQMSKIAWTIIAAVGEVISLCQSETMGDAGEYIASICVMMATKVSNLLNCLVFDLPYSYGIDSTDLDPLVHVISALAVVLKSRLLQENIRKDTVREFEMHTEKLWSNFRIRRGIFLATLTEDDIKNEGDNSNIRGYMKKHGAGAGNWGQIGDEMLEDRRKEVIMENEHANDKLQMLSDKQFTKLRRWSQ